MAELLTLREAVERFVHDGDTVALEGFTHLIPTAAAHEVVRQGRKDLTLVRMTPDLVYDLLIGAGCAKKLPRTRQAGRATASPHLNPGGVAGFRCDVHRTIHDAS